MNVHEIVRAWGTILSGRRPSLSIEITRECPLRCPGCYAYEPGHAGEGLSLRQLSDFKGDALVAKVLALLDEYRPASDHGALHHYGPDDAASRLPSGFS